jgi:F-type H+-transporting ATPase subunit delta
MISRPYAKAAFETALEKKDISAWETMLQNAAEFSQNDLIQRVLKQPHITEKELTDLFCDALKKFLNEEQKNFIHLLAETKKLNALPDIYKLFIAMRAQYEKTLTVQVISAIKLDEKYQKKLADALTKRWKQQVSLECSVDPNLLAGVMIRTDDKVIDGSVRGKLDRMIDFI